jgi:hypothetical protein
LKAEFGGVALEEPAQHLHSTTRFTALPLAALAACENHIALLERTDLYQHAVENAVLGVKQQASSKRLRLGEGSVGSGQP